MAAQRADRAGWRRIARSDDRWQLVVTQTNCTPGDIWEALQRQCYLTVAPDHELNREWEFLVTLASENPNDMPPRQESRRSQTYRDRMMRALRR